MSRWPSLKEREYLLLSFHDTIYTLRIHYLIKSHFPITATSPFCPNFESPLFFSVCHSLSSASALIPALGAFSLELYQCFPISPLLSPSSGQFHP